MTLTLAPPTTITTKASAPHCAHDDYECINTAHLHGRSAVELACCRTTTAIDALTWLIVRGFHIAEQLDTEPRRQLQAYLLAPALQDDLLTRICALHTVTLEIADPETLYELRIQPRAGEAS
ncbi:hypothetical protein ACTWJ8_39980 (plasmid) [Streptomyces sp. SDT5-1]|uniref:hypothetical protein n=1 Tax=Streptomyces sp. SDT5-1 TaxID=3406418 RepID=UPI003FD591D2